MTKREKDSNENKNQALLSVIKNIRDEPERIWNSLELYLRFIDQMGGLNQTQLDFLRVSKKKCLMKSTCFDVTACQQ